MTILLTEEQKLAQDSTRRFAREVLHPAAMEADRTGADFPTDVLKQMHAVGLLGLDIPEAYGGQGFDTFTASVILEEIAYGWFSAASYAMTLATGPILFAGSESQRRRILPGVCKGECVTAFALTEPDAGSDASSIRTFAARDGSDYVITGTKCFITNAHRADVFVVFARTDREAPRGAGISIFLVDKGTPGLSVGRRFKTLGHDANPIWEVVFDRCRVPRESLLGEENKGFFYIQQSFATKIRASHGPRSIGVAQAAVDYAIRYGTERKVFGEKVVALQGNRFKIADILTKIEAARQLNHWAARLADSDDADRAAAAASMGKLMSSNVCMEATAEAIQLMGGHGLVTDHPLERYYREAKLFQIGDGSSEVLRLLVSRFATRQAASGQSVRVA